jgi:hypothetical protein
VREKLKLHFARILKAIAQSYIIDIQWRLLCLHWHHPMQMNCEKKAEKESVRVADKAKDCEGSVSELLPPSFVLIQI